MKTWWLIPLALPLMAASPPRQLTLAVPSDSLSLPTGQPAFSVGSAPRQPAGEPAPLPNRDVRAPRAAPGSTETSLAPTLFTQREQYRGDGFSPGSTAQSEQEHRYHPAAGFSLHMPFQPQ